MFCFKSHVSCSFQPSSNQYFPISLFDASFVVKDNPNFLSIYYDFNSHFIWYIIYQEHILLFLSIWRYTLRFHFYLTYMQQFFVYTIFGAFNNHISNGCINARVFGEKYLIFIFFNTFHIDEKSNCSLLIGCDYFLLLLIRLLFLNIV